MDLAIDSSRETFRMPGADFSAPSMTTTNMWRAAQLFDLALDDVRFTSSGFFCSKELHLFLAIKYLSREVYCQCVWRAGHEI